MMLGTAAAWARVVRGALSESYVFAPVCAAQLMQLDWSWQDVTVRAAAGSDVG
jgi:hypothetical protein